MTAPSFLRLIYTQTINNSKGTLSSKALISEGNRTEHVFQNPGGEREPKLKRATEGATVETNIAAREHFKIEVTKEELLLLIGALGYVFEMVEDEDKPQIEAISKHMARLISGRALI